MTDNKTNGTNLKPPGFALMDDKANITARKNFNNILNSHTINPQKPSEFLPKEYADAPKSFFEILKQQNFYEWSHQNSNEDVSQLLFKSLYLNASGVLIIVSEEPEIASDGSLNDAFKTAVEQSGHSIMTTDLDGKITYVNPALEESTGYVEEELIGRNPRVFQSGKQDDAFYEELWETILSGEVWNGEIINQRKDDSLYVIDQTIAPITDSHDEISGFIAVNRDVTKTWSEREELKKKVKNDPNLQIPIKEVLFEQIEKRHSDQSAVNDSLYIISLDNNELLEQIIGPYKVQLVVKTILEQIRSLIQPGDLIGKYHENELLLYSDRFKVQAEAEKFAKKLSEVINRTVQNDGVTHKLNISLGFTFRQSNEESTEVLLEEANSALLATQQTDGSDIQLFLPEHHELRQQKLEEIKFKDRINEGFKNNEFTSHFQPIIDLSTGEIEGFEALMRWDHPDEGILTPFSFIDQAREANLLIDIENSILTSSFETIADLNKEFDDRTFDLHMNIEPNQFGNSEFPTRLKNSLDETILSANNIHVEIVESSELREEDALDSLHDIKESGFNLSVDDFGTGFSSLDYLIKIPADTVKIDRSLIEEINEDNPSSPVLFAVVSMIRNLDKLVIVEGIETKFQHQIAKGMNCDFTQGYLYAKPMGADQLPEFIKNYEPALANIRGEN